MDTETNKLDNIQVLVCLADEDKGTELAHGLREEGLDVLVAHRIRAAMRVMDRESPQAVVVEVATTAYDGFRVAQWASGRVMALFLVAGRPLTLMEDVEVLKSGVKEVFYTPVQASTIAASIRGACGIDTRQALGDAAAEPKTRFSAPSTLMNRDVALASTSRQDAIPWDDDMVEALDDPATIMSPATVVAPPGMRPATEAMTPEAAPAVEGMLDTLTDSGDGDDKTPSLQEQIRLQAEALGLDQEDGPLPADDMFYVDPSMTGQDLMRSRDEDFAYSDQPPAAESDTSASLVADLFDAPVSSAPQANAPSNESDTTPGPKASEPPPERSTAQPSPPRREAMSRKINAPPDDDLLVVGMMDDLDDFESDSLASSPQPTGEEDTEEPAVESPPTTTEEEEGPQYSPTELADEPSTSEFMAAAYGTSKTPQTIARLLTAAVICASAWTGWQFIDRSGGLEASDPAPDEKELSPEEAEALRKQEKLHATLSEAAIAHREGDLDLAREEYKSALKQDPEAHMAVRGLAAIAMSERNWAETRKSLNRLTMLQPDDPSLPLQQGLVLKQLGKKQPSRAELRRFIDSTATDDPRIRPAAKVYLSMTRGGP